MIPEHLKRYIVEQNYSRYTSEDQAIWRYILRQLKAYLAVHAHPCYLDGLKKTGIEEDHIPHIEQMSEKLERFGWRAVAVSGFIPPAAFMELQSLSILPIASDMRTLEHLHYTPAPDIVHEAAGHAPILVDPGFAGYLKQYAQVAKHAIIGKRDLDQYEAIRILSDLKEDPDSTPAQIKEAEHQLNEVNKKITFISEAALLGRMNWWTAEYGLIGSLENPKIFGAGLLSSVGEARSCLHNRVKKIPLTIDCVNYTYDITEPQPQLFVTPDFDTLGEVLEQLASRMAFRQGGISGLHKILQAQTVNTVELNSGLQIGGVLSNYILENGHSGKDLAHPESPALPIYLQFSGPTQLAEKNLELSGHSVRRHAHGFGSPLGKLRNEDKCLSSFKEKDMLKHGLRQGSRCHLHFQSGVEVQGDLVAQLRSAEGKNLVWTFTNCRVTRGDLLLFDPSWGEFDMGIGCSVPSVFSGPADRDAYGRTEDFANRRVATRTFAPMIQHKHSLYAKVEKARLTNNCEVLEDILTELEENFPDEWLMRLDILEICRKSAVRPEWTARVEMELKNLAERYQDFREPIENGLQLLDA